MWYFSWILGLGLACAFGILNAMWLELDHDDEKGAEQTKQVVRKKSALSALFGAPEPARDDAPREE